MPITEIPAHADEKVRKSFENTYKASEDNDILPIIFEVWPSTDYSKSYTSTEWIESAEYFDENGELVEVKPPEGYKVVWEAKEYWLMMRTTKKEMLNTKDVDTLISEYEKRKIPALIDSLHFKRRTEAFKLLNDGFTTALAPGGKPIFATHKFKSSDVTFKNVTNIEAWEKAMDFIEKYCGELVDSKNRPIDIDINIIIVKKGWFAAKKFKQVLAWNEKLKARTIWEVNVYNNWKYTLLETKHIKNEKHWFAMDNKKDKAFILDDIQKPQLDKWEEFSKSTQKWTHSATGSMRIICANLPIYMVGSFWDDTTDISSL